MGVNQIYINLATFANIHSSHNIVVFILFHISALTAIQLLSR